MDILRTALDKVGEKFNKGEKYAPLHALYEAPDTILYTPKDVTRGPSHVRDGLDLKRMMIVVVVALWAAKPNSSGICGRMGSPRLRPKKL